MAKGTTTSKGAQLFVSVALPTTYDAAGMAALTWTKVGKVEQIGTIGADTETVSFTDLDGDTEKHKGATNNGSLSPQMGYSEADAGQAILVSLSDVDDEASVKVLLRTGAIRYNVGRVFGMPETIGAANSIVMANPRIELNRKTIRVAAPTT